MEKETTHNIIGDLHGSDEWKSLVDNSLINVFVGDFFDPYSNSITYEMCRDNFLQIIEYKRQHPETVILWGNHEYHYLMDGEIPERYSRYDFCHAKEIIELLHNHADSFNGIAYSLNNMYLVTHAGVSTYWYWSWIDMYADQTPDEVAEQINNLWLLNKRAFSVTENRKNAYNNNESAQSPIWMRPPAIQYYNIFAHTPYSQIFGHTPCDSIVNDNGLICVDCLRSDQAKEKTLII